MNKRKIVAIIICCLLVLGVGHHLYKRSQMKPTVEIANHKSFKSAQLLKGIFDSSHLNYYAINLPGGLKTEPFEYSSDVQGHYGKKKLNGGIYVKDGKYYTNFTKKWKQSKPNYISPADYKLPLQILNTKDFQNSIKYSFNSDHDINVKLVLNKKQRQQLLNTVTRKNLSKQLCYPLSKDATISKVTIDEIVYAKSKTIRDIQETIEVSSKPIKCSETVELNNLNAIKELNPPGNFDYGVLK